MLIKFARGDSHQAGFVMKRNGSIVDDPFDEIYFTVKRNYSDRDFLFQKTLSNGGIVYGGDGRYTIFIQPEDTNGLEFGDFDFDIEVKNNDGYKRTFYGELKLTKEVTHYYNE